MCFLFGSLTMAQNLRQRPKSLQSPLTPIGSCRDFFSLLSFLEMCAPLARNHTFLQKHRKPHAWIREQLSKSAHLPDPTHAGTKYPRSGEPLTPILRATLRLASDHEAPPAQPASQSAQPTSRAQHSPARQPQPQPRPQTDNKSSQVMHHGPTRDAQGESLSHSPTRKGGHPSHRATRDAAFSQ